VIRQSVIALAAFAGCDSAIRAPANGTIDVRDPDVHVLAGSDSLAVVEDLEVHPNGDVWVLNSDEPFFIGFDADGAAIAVHGRRGGGPAELEAPAGLVIGGVAGEAWVFDRRRHALIRMSRPDADRREAALPPDAIPPGSVLGGMNLLSDRVRNARLGDEVVMPRARIEGEIEASSYWFYT